MTPPDLEAKLERLTRLIGTDEGFYVLALHSFTEYWLRYEKGYGDGPRIRELTWAFRDELLDERGESFIEGLPALGHLGHQMQREISNLQGKNKDLPHQRDEYQRLKSELEDLQSRLTDHDRKLERARSIADQRHGRIDALRGERNELVQERNRLLTSLEDYRQLELYLSYLGRLSLYPNVAEEAALVDLCGGLQSREIL